MSEGESERARENDAERLAEMRAAFQRGDYGVTREGARRLAERAGDEAVRAEARELAARTGASRGMIAMFAAAAVIVVMVCGYWLVQGP